MEVADGIRIYSHLRDRREKMNIPLRITERQAVALSILELVIEKMIISKEDCKEFCPQNVKVVVIRILWQILKWTKKRT